jgi:hypothetical protein
MDDNTVEQKFETIVLNEQILVMDRELGRVSGVNGVDGRGGELPFDKFLKPSSEPLPDIDTDYEDPWRNFMAGRTDI